jgi:hypothetical protein
MLQRFIKKNIIISSDLPDDYQTKTLQNIDEEENEQFKLNLKEFTFQKLESL